MRKTKRFDVGGLSDEEGKLNVFNPTTNMERELQIDYEQRRKANQEEKAIRDKGGRGLGIEDFTTGNKTPARTNTYEYKEDAVTSPAPLPQAKRIITKEQMAAKGFTNLTDYLNDERKLKRRDGKPVERAKPATGTKGGFRDISQSPRLTDMVQMQTLAARAANRALNNQLDVKNQEQNRLADIAQRNVVPPEESAKSRNRILKAYTEGTQPAYLEHDKRAAASTKAFSDQGQEIEYRKGGKVAKTKTFARGGKVSIASSRGDGIAQRGKTKGRIC